MRINPATLAARLTEAGVRYTTENHDGGVVVFVVPPRLEWDRPVEFYCVGGLARCEYRCARTVADGIRLARLGGVLA